MTKKDILNKIKRTILGEDAGTPGITVTKKTQKTEKKFSDDYYKETDKKFKDYLGIKKDDFDALKVNADENQEKTYGGSGMEGLTYDNEGTEVEKKFTKRVKDLNKPSKDYYLKKDEIDNTFEKLEKKSKTYKEDKKKFQNTPPVRAVQAEGTIKRLTYKTEFVNESTAINLIPEEFKQDSLVFEMTDGNKLMKVRWEGGKNGRAVVLLSKDGKKINEELNRMYQLFEYNSRDTFGKTNLLTEEKELDNMVKTFRGKDETDPSPGVAAKISPPKEMNIEVREKGDLISAAKYLVDKPEIPVAPGNIASYDKRLSSWTITTDPKVSKEDLETAVKSVMEKNPQSTAMKPSLRNAASQMSKALGKEKVDILITLGGGA
jgi:hypothetical protein